MNKEKIAVLTDSCSDIPASIAADMGLFIVPMQIFVGNKSYADGIDIFPSDIYRHQSRGERIQTSLPSGVVIQDTLDTIKARGYKKVIAMITSPKLSGTFNLINVMAKEYDGLEIAVFDSKNSSVGMGMIVYQLLEDVQGGMCWDTLISCRVNQLINNTYTFFTLDSLEYLMKGGRIGKVGAIAGTVLHIKPILSFSEEGQLYCHSKVRGIKQAEKKIAELIGRLQEKHPRYNLAVASGSMPELMSSLHNVLKTSLSDYDHFWEGEIGATLVTHNGPGILGAAITLLD